MDPYDKEKTRQIWKRVLGEEAAPEQCAKDPERLRKMIAAEKTAACNYRRLARGAHCGAVLQRLAREELCHSRKLEALYFLWTGARSETVSGKLPCYASIPEALRALHQAELETAAGYRRAAEDLPAHREMLLELAEEELRHARQLFQVLQQYLA